MKTKKILSILMLSMLPIVCMGQKYQLYATQNIHNQLRLNSATGEVLQMQDDGQKWTIVKGFTPNGQRANRYKLFETRNMWTFIELDTFTGKLWQVQFSTQGEDYMMYVPINEKELITSKGRSVFTIQPMTSMYQYYLINEDNGDMWKFQWTTQGDEYRWIEKM